MPLHQILRREWSQLFDEAYLLDMDHRRQKVNMLCFCSLFLILHTAIYLICLWISEPVDSVLFFMGAVSYALCLWLSATKASRNWTQLVFCGYILFFTNRVLLFSDQAPLAVCWIFVIPSVACFLLGNKRAIPFLVFLLINMLVFFSPILANRYSSSFDVREQEVFVGLYLADCCLSIFMEHLRYGTTSRLVRLTQSFSQTAHQDPLTKLYNRRAFYEILEKLLSLSQHNGVSNVYIIIVDIDHFKKINDQYGHQCGDAYLLHATTLLTKQLRDSDYCFRWGGEEFLLLFSNLSRNDVFAVIDRLRISVEHTPLITHNAAPVKATMSFGLHEYNMALNANENVARADALLYKAKKNGRNRIEKSWDFHS